MMRTAMRMLVAGTLAAVVGAGCTDGGKGGLRERPAPQVAVRTVERIDTALRRSYLVSLLPGEQAGVLSRVSGYVLRLDADRGDRVAKGDRLAVVERDELDAQRRQAAAQLDAARASLVNAEDQARRLSGLRERELVAQADADAADTALRVAQAQVKAAEAALNMTRTRASWADITAPFDGYVIRRDVDVGALVGPQGPALFLVGTVATIKAVATIPQADAGRIVVGMPVELTLDGADGSFEGRISRFAPALEATTRSLEVELAFDNPDGILKPGMYGRVSLEIDRLQDAVVLPPRAVVRRGEIGTAFVVRDGVAREVSLTLGRTLPDGRVEVLSGLSEGDVLITLGRDLVRDGLEVRTVPDAGLGE
jgi:RND family efflux transporter MFP subunit